MNGKTCFKCGSTKPRSEFYKHSQMADGLLGKCKECTKKDSTARRNANLSEVREYDRNRGNRQDASYQRQYRHKYPKKYVATSAVMRAIKSGLLQKQPCEVCNSSYRVHAHHDDYDKPLSVRWLCPEHHRQWHVANGEAANGK